MADWKEQVDGKAQYAPPIPPLAPAKFTGSVYIAEGNKPRAERVNFASSLQSATRNFVVSVQPNGAVTAGLLGYMFWAAELQHKRRTSTQTQQARRNRSLF